VAFVAIAEVLAHVFRPHVGFRQQEAVGVLRVDGGAQFLDDGVRFGQVLVGGAVALDQVGNGIQPEAVDAHVEPEPHRLEDGFQHHRVVEVQIRLVAEEAMPEVLLGNRVPSPVGGLGVRENDPRALVDLVGVAPHVEVAFRRTGRRQARGLEPRVLVRRVIDDQLRDDAQAAYVGRSHHFAKVVERAVLRVHVLVLGNVVAIVTQRRRVERHQPDGVDAQRLHVVELGSHTLEVAHTIVVGVEKRLDVELVDHRVAIPLGIVLAVEFDRLQNQGGHRCIHEVAAFEGRWSKKIFEIVLVTQSTSHHEDMGRHHIRIEPDVVVLTLP